MPLARVVPANGIYTMEILQIRDWAKMSKTIAKHVIKQQNPRPEPPKCMSELMNKSKKKKKRFYAMGNGTEL